MKIPCLSLWQPWASLLMAGVKIHETRSWPPPRNLIGRVFVIQAAARAVEPGYFSDQLGEELFGLCHERIGDPFSFPRGCALGTALLATAFEISWLFDVGTQLAHDDWIAGDWRRGIGRWAWRFEEPEPFEKPIALRGRQRIWYEPADRFGLQSEAGGS